MTNIFVWNILTRSFVFDNRLDVFVGVGVVEGLLKFSLRWGGGPVLFSPD